MVGLHLRGGVSVLVLSLTSLFVCWNSYVNVGFERNNYMGSVQHEVMWLMSALDLVGASDIHGLMECAK